MRIRINVNNEIRFSNKDFRYYLIPTVYFRKGYMMNGATESYKIAFKFLKWDLEILFLMWDEIDSDFKIK